LVYARKWEKEEGDQTPVASRGKRDKGGAHCLRELKIRNPIEPRGREGKKGEKKTQQRRRSRPGESPLFSWILSQKRGGDNFSQALVGGGGGKGGENKKKDPTNYATGKRTIASSLSRRVLLHEKEAYFP